MSETTQPNDRLQAIVTQAGLEPSKGQVILARFHDFFAIAADWERKARAITVTSAADIEAIKLAREGRLLLKQKRVEVEHTRRNLKEESLREGQTIDGIAKTLTGIIAPIETDLAEKENFVAIQEQKRQDTLRAERTPKLQAFGVDPSLYDLGRMPEEQFLILLGSFMIAKENEEKKRQEEEANRLKQEEENRRIREENERLKKEAEAKEKERIHQERQQKERERKIREEEEKKRKAEQEEANKKLEAERRERERLEAEERQRKQAEEEEKKKQAAEERKASRAPDKVKWIAFLNVIAKLEEPIMKTEEGAAIMSVFREKLMNLVYDTKKQVEAL